MFPLSRTTAGWSKCRHSRLFSEVPEPRAGDHHRVTARLLSHTFPARRTITRPGANDQERPAQRSAAARAPVGTAACGDQPVNRPWSSLCRIGRPPPTISNELPLADRNCQLRRWHPGPKSRPKRSTDPKSGRIQQGCHGVDFACRKRNEPARVDRSVDTLAVVSYGGTQGRTYSCRSGRAVARVGPRPCRRQRRRRADSQVPSEQPTGNRPNGGAQDVQPADSDGAFPLLSPSHLAKE